MHGTMDTKFNENCDKFIFYSSYFYRSYNSTDDIHSINTYTLFSNQAYTAGTTQSKILLGEPTFTKPF
jgi:hypothetical protein